MIKTKSYLFCRQRKYDWIQLRVVSPEVDNFPHRVYNQVWVEAGPAFELLAGSVGAGRLCGVSAPPPHRAAPQNNFKYPHPRKHSPVAVQLVISLPCFHTRPYILSSGKDSLTVQNITAS